MTNLLDELKKRKCMECGKPLAEAKGIKYVTKQLGFSFWLCDECNENEFEP